MALIELTKSHILEMYDLDDLVSFDPSSNKLLNTSDDFVSYESLFDSGSYVAGIVEDNSLVATTVLSPFNMFARPCSFENKDLCLMGYSLVHPDYRGRGFQKKLITACINHLRPFGLEELYSFVHVDNKFSLNNLHDSGFTKYQSVKPALDVYKYRGVDLVDRIQVVMNSSSRKFSL